LDTDEKRAKVSSDTEDFAKLVTQTLEEAQKKPKYMLNGKMAAIRMSPSKKD